MTNKRRVVVFLIVTAFVLLLAGVLYFFNQKFHFFADENSSYLLFSKSPFEPVYSNTLPNSGEILNNESEINLFAARGETEPMTFSVRPNIDLGSAEISITDFENGSGKITKDNFDLYNIKVWAQCGPKEGADADWIRSCNDSEKTATYNIPELLVKDSEQDLQAAERGWVQEDKKYYAPVVNQEFNVEIEKGSTHTFYLSMKIPDDATVGVYRGKVLFKPENAESQEFFIKLEVLPFGLPESDKEVVLHLTQRISDGADFGFADIGREKYDQYLDMIRQAGVTGVVVLFTEDEENDADDLKWLVDKIKEKGFHGTLILREGLNDGSEKIRRNLSKLQGQGFDVYIYGRDEPNNLTAMGEELDVSNRVHEAGGKVATSVRKQCSEDLSDTNCPIYDLFEQDSLELIDLPIYKITDSSADCDFYNSWEVALNYKKLSPFFWVDGLINRVDSSKTGIFCCAWHRITTTWDSATEKMATYVDGVLDTETSVNGTQLPSNLENLIIGASDKNGTNSFLGSIDSVKIYNRALNISEIDDARSKNLVADYSFDEGNGETTANKVNNEKCQIQGADWVAGQNGQALQFNGTNSYVDCPETTDLSIKGAITVDAWVKVNSDAGNDRRTIVGKTLNPSRQSVREYITGLQNGTGKKNLKKEFYYFQIWPEQMAGVSWTNLSYIRTMTGFFLYKSGLNGIAPYGLDSVYRGHGNKEYDDFDSASKDFRAVYRTDIGWLKTIQYEAFREGIDDLKYLTKLDEVLKSLELKNPGKASELKLEINNQLKIYTYSGNENPTAVTTVSDNINRKFIADKIVEAMSLLNENGFEAKKLILKGINLTENQMITTNPYIINLEVTNTSLVSRVEFFVDDNLICVSTLPDVEKNYSCSWDTSKYHSIVKAIIYNTDGTTEETAKSTTVNLSASYQSAIISILPQTGETRDLMRKIIGL